MKRIIGLILTIVLTLSVVLTLASCNKQIFDTTYAFDYALVQFPDGTCEKIEIKTWTDYEDGEQIQITSKDGTTYLVNSVNCILVSE